MVKIFSKCQLEKWKENQGKFRITKAQISEKKPKRMAASLFRIFLESVFTTAFIWVLILSLDSSFYPICAVPRHWLLVPRIINLELHNPIPRGEFRSHYFSLGDRTKDGGGQTRSRGFCSSALTSCGNRCFRLPRRSVKHFWQKLVTFMLPFEREKPGK